MNPILSIIIPCYNHGLYISETIKSIEVSKDKYPIEIIIVNDGSTDLTTIQVLKEIESKGYFVLNQKNGGLGNARNNGIKIARGKYILPLDSDNKVEKPYLNNVIDILEKNPDIDIVYGNALQFGEASGTWVLDDYNLQHLLLSNFIDACAVYKKTVWEKNGGYDEKMPIMGYEDWDFWINSSLNNFRFHHHQDICFQYRVLNNSMIRTVSGKGIDEVYDYFQKKYDNLIDYNFCKKFVISKLKYTKEDVVMFSNTMSYKILFKYIMLKALTDIKRNTGIDFKRFLMKKYN